MIVLAGFAPLLINNNEYLSFINLSNIVMKLVAMAAILICILLIKKRISQFYILYGAALFFLLISLKEF